MPKIAWYMYIAVNKQRRVLVKTPPTNLDSSTQHLVQYVSSVLHDSDVRGGGVSALTVGDGVGESILELFQRPEEIWLHKTHHGVVWDEE